MSLVWPMAFEQRLSEAIREASQASSRRTDPETSQKAAQAVSPGLTDLERAILRVVPRCYPVSAFAIAAAVNDLERDRWGSDTIRSCVSRLAKRGALAKADTPALSPRGNACETFLLP